MWNCLPSSLCSCTSKLKICSVLRWCGSCGTPGVTSGPLAVVSSLPREHSPRECESLSDAIVRRRKGQYSQYIGSSKKRNPSESPLSEGFCSLLRESLIGLSPVYKCNPYLLEFDTPFTRNKEGKVENAWKFRRVSTLKWINLSSAH